MRTQENLHSSSQDTDPSTYTSQTNGGKGEGGQAWARKEEGEGGDQLGGLILLVLLLNLVPRHGGAVVLGGHAACGILDYFHRTVRVVCHRGNQSRHLRKPQCEALSLSPLSLPAQLSLSLALHQPIPSFRSASRSLLPLFLTLIHSITHSPDSPIVCNISIMYLSPHNSFLAFLH